MKLLGIDVSSTNLGWCVTENNTPTHWGVIVLSGLLAERCYKATIEVFYLIAEYAPDAVAIESAVANGGRFITSLLVQSEVRGAIRGVIQANGLLDIDVSPLEAKKALTGKAHVKGVTGKEEKQRIMEAALPFMAVGICEHEADAYAVALAASKKVVVHE